MTNNDLSILIVDTDPTIMEGLGIRLQECGVSVAFASSGHEALQALEKREVSLVMSEIELADMSGLKLVCNIHEKNEHQGCVFYTAADLDGFLELSTEVHAIGIFHKSQPLETLVMQLVMHAQHESGVHKLLERNTLMSRRLAAVQPLERMIGRYAERWKTTEGEARKVITLFARSQRLPMAELARISEQYSAQVQATRDDIDTYRQAKEDQLQSSEPGMLTNLDVFHDQHIIDPAAARRAIANGNRKSARSAK